MISRIHKAEYLPGQFVEFPSYRYTRETEQGLHNSFTDLTGADYGYDMVGIGRAAKKNAIERIAFLLIGTPAEVNTAFEDLQTNLQGRIKLWSTDDIDELWAYARLVSMPLLRLDVINRQHMPVTLVFERMTDWQVEGS